MFLPGGCEASDGERRSVLKSSHFRGARGTGGAGGGRREAGGEEGLLSDDGDEREKGEKEGEVSERELIRVNRRLLLGPGAKRR